MSCTVVGDQIQGFWHLEDVYYPGTNASINSDGTDVVNNEDGETATPNLASETWRRTEIMSAQHAGLPQFSSESPNVLQSMLEIIGQKPSLLKCA